MRIKDLPSGTPTSSDNLAIDNGTAVRKTPFSSFEAGDNVVTFTSGDEAEPAVFKSVEQVVSGPLKTVLNKLTSMASNVRFLYGFIGTTSIGGSGDTITDVISGLLTKVGTTAMGTTATTITGAIAELRQMLTQSALVNTIPGLLTRGAATDFNSATATGNYTYTSSTLNKPPIDAGGQFNVYRYSATYIVQEAFINSSSSSAKPRVFIRRSYSAGNWTSWYEFTIS